MIRTLSGTIIDMTLGSVVLDVHGVGYLISIQSGYAQDQHIGDTLSLFTHLAVREDSLTLYGFFSRDDLALFEQLLTLPKIGPKSALQILSQASPELLKKAVASQDFEHLSKVSGMGKKTAEKVVLGLKDVFGAGAFLSTGEQSDGDVIDALTTLGYSQKEARDVVQKLDRSVTDTNARIKEALKLLSR